MPTVRRGSSFPFVLLVMACSGRGGAPNAKPSAVVATIDSIMNAKLATGRLAGGSVAVMKGSDTILIKGYGKADLELDVPTPAHAVYEIGSVTKQFTAAAILQLRDDGKLSLDDNITTHLPGYPTQGNTIPVRRLLDHTSGIKGYTEIASFGDIAPRHLPKDSLVALFRNEKFDFPTGTQMTYNNSAYFLAGLIIEKLSGMSYADYVKKHFFDKVGMADSRYCSESEIQRGKVKGYDVAPDTTLRLKSFIDHVYPFSAGSLCSSAIDLVKWNRALHNGGVLSAAAYKDLIEPSTLNDGTVLRYAKGLAWHNMNGHRLVEHGGGIPGFLSASHYYPDDSLTVVVLFNTAGPVAPGEVATDIAKAILPSQPETEQPFRGDLSAFVGTYTGAGRGEDTKIEIAVDGGKLSLRRDPKEKGQTLRFVGNDTWEEGETRLRFVPMGRSLQLRLDGIYGYNLLTRR